MSDIYSAPSSVPPVGPLYHVAKRRAEQAVRRGDMKTALGWLDIAKREMDLAERFDSGRIRQEKQRAWRHEQPLQLRALERRANFGR